MRPIEVPKSYRPGLLALYKLSDAGVETLIAALASASPNISWTKFSSSVASQVPDIPHEESSGMVDALIGMSGYRLGRDMRIPDFADGIWAGMQADKETDYQGIEPSRKERFVRQLTRLLGADAVCITAKAVSVLLEHENLYCKARILTEMRPVFGEDASVRPQASVVYHMLKIHYHQRDKLKDVFFALDDDEVKELIVLLKRAEEKSAALRSALADANLAPLDED